MAQTPLIKMGSTIKVDGNEVTVQTIHRGYIVAMDKKHASKVFAFEKLEKLFK